MDGVRSRTDHGVDDRGSAAVLGGIRILQNFEFLNRIDRKIDTIAALALYSGFNAIDEEAVLLNTVSVARKLWAAALRVPLEPYAIRQ
jgi:hypothetical protein